MVIDTALHTIEKDNKALRGALPDNYFSRLGLDVTKLASLLDTINDIDTTKDPKQDVVGKVYEYFLSNFDLDIKRCPCIHLHRFECLQDLTEHLELKNVCF